MNQQLQHYLITFIEQLDENFGYYHLTEAKQIIKVIWATNYQNASSIFLGTNMPSKTGAAFLLLPELMLFFGIFYILTLIGYRYSKSDTTNLFIIIYNHSTVILFWSTAVLIIQWLLIMYNYQSLFYLWGCNFYLFPEINWLHGIYFYNHSYQISAFSQSIKLILLLIALLINVYLPTVLNSNIVNTNELPLLLLITTILAFVIISAQNYALLLLALEGLSLILYILTTTDRLHGGIMAAAKYFVFGTLGSVLLFWGVAHLYSIAPSLGFSSQRFINEMALWYYIPHITGSVTFASLSIITGFLIKLGAAPLHQWVPDVYAGSPLVVTAYFSTSIKLIIFMLLCCFSYRANGVAITDTFAICSLLVGGILTIRQLEIKRFIAYSSITHVGFLLLGDLNASFIYILTYICSSLLFFSIILSINLDGKELVYLTDLRNMKGNSLLQSGSLVISLASMAGLPPFSGFFGKLLVWESLVEDLYLYNDRSSYNLLIISLLVTLITIFYYMRIVIYIYVGNDDVQSPAVSFIANINQTAIFNQQIALSLIVSFWVLFQSKVVSISLVVIQSIALV